MKLDLKTQQEMQRKAREYTIFDVLLFYPTKSAPTWNADLKGKVQLHGPIGYKKSQYVVYIALKRGNRIVLAERHKFEGLNTAKVRFVEFASYMSLEGFVSMCK
jgi:hypothetical protein